MHARNLIRILAALWMLAACALPAAAQLQAGPPSPPPTETPPAIPGLYVGIKDQNGVAASWVRVNGLKDKGEIVPYLSGHWGDGLVQVPLMDLSMADIYYSDGHIQADLHLRSGDRMKVELLNPYTSLEGWWRRNNYSIPLAGVRQMWFRYIPRGRAQGEFYNGPPLNMSVQGVIDSVELHGSGGRVVLTTSRGDVLNLEFAYRRMRGGQELLQKRAGYLPGRPVKIVFLLSTGPDGRALRDIRTIATMRAEASR